MQDDLRSPGTQFSDQNHDKWGAPILIVGMLLVLVGAVIFARTLLQKNSTPVDDYFETQYNDTDRYNERSSGAINPSYNDESEEGNKDEGVEETEAQTTEFSWEDLDINVLGITAADEFEGALPKYSESIDVTGDGILEAIFRGPSSNHDAAIILQKDSQGNVKRLQEKIPSGEVAPVYLFRVARAVVNTDYGFLAPTGYYRVSRSLDENGRLFVCDHFEVYIWDSLSGYFIFDLVQSQTLFASMCPHGIN